MGYQMCLGAALVVLFYVQIGDALQCWKCSSDIDIDCADYFNTTRFARRFLYDNVQTRTPYLQTCGDDRNSLYGQRYVCQKRKETYGSQTVIFRQCTSIPASQVIGKCSQESSGSRRVEFCEYCDYDGCNAASSLQYSAILTALIPLSLYFLLRK